MDKQPNNQAGRWRNRIIGYGEEAPDQLLAHERNSFKIHPKAQQDAMSGVLGELGWLAPVIVSRRTGKVVDGHLRVSVALSRSEAAVPVAYVDIDPEEEAEALATFDPIGAMVAYDKDELDALLREVSTGDAAVQAMLADLAKENGLVLDGGPKVEAPDAQIDKAEELRERWQTAAGQLWELPSKSVPGKAHRLLCGDSTKAGDVARLMGGEGISLLLTDPPYCSGGFQEAGRKSGSIGTRGDEMIANDTLSTRGYMALLKAVLSLANTGVIYVFTDWRMWVNLFDLAESSGYGVRNMIVWDKGSPGMGVGWRSQHELILCGVRVSHPFSPQKAQGNVIQSGRTGNSLHPTEKPVDLLTKILSVNDLATSVYDPFAGSGPTLVAAEQTNRYCYGMEIDPKYVAVNLQRLADMGLEPRLMTNA